MLKPPPCIGCPLHSLGDGFSSPEGDCTSGVAIIGEALGYEEFQDALPFRPQAAAGSKLEEIFRLTASDLSRPISRKQFLLWNIIACKPPSNELVGSPYEWSAIEHCKVHFDKIILNNPKVKIILALGATAMRVLTGFTGLASEKQSIFDLRGYVFPTKYGLVIPSLHPSYLKRGANHLTPLVVEDLKKALAIAGGTYTNYSHHPSYVPPNFNTHPSLDDAWSFYHHVKDNPNLVLAYDIETPETGNIDEDERDDLANAEITLVQFSTAKDTGIALPTTSEYWDVIRKLLSETENHKGNHNTWNFDNPRLRARGVDIKGVVHDTMWMFKHWQPSLPRGLQSVVSHLAFPYPWKFLYSSDLNWYGCSDVSADQYILQMLPAFMQKRGIWEGYVNHVVRMHYVLERASNTGIPISSTKVQEVETYFKTERKQLNKELQQNVPDIVRNIRPKRKNKVTGEFDFGYVRQPTIITEELSRYQTLVEYLSKTDQYRGQEPIPFTDYLYKRHNLTYGQFKANTSGNGLGNVPSEDYFRWCRIDDFKGSSQQLVRYLKWKQGEVSREIERLTKQRSEDFGGKNPELTKRLNEQRDFLVSYQVPKHFKTKKDTTGKKEIEELYEKNGDPVLEQVLRIRSLDTNLNNYLPNWKPSYDGRVHTTWGFTAPTGQKDSRAPNILNCSKHTEYGNIFRGIIEAPQGYCFVELDKKSFHVATTGYLANDKKYIRFSQIDPHSILGSYIDPSIIGCSIDLNWTDADIISACKEFKKKCKEHKAKDPTHNIDVRQEMAKPTVLGNQLGLGPKKLQYQNRKFIKTVAEAEKFQQTIKDLFPKVVLAQKYIVQTAFEQRYLIDEFGKIQYFFDIYNFKWDKKNRCWDRRESEGAREPLAFRVQGVAFGMLDTEILEMDRLGICEEHQFLNTIHDSVIFMPEIGKRDKFIEQALEVMNMPCGKLVNDATGKDGLRIKQDVSVGRNWRAKDKDRNPEGMEEIKI